jgi:hypothetical protein
MIMHRYTRVILVAVMFSFAGALSSSKEVLRAQDVDKPAIAPQPRTINLTQEQRFIIKENVKDLRLSRAPKDAPETIGDRCRRTLSFTPYRRKWRVRCRKHVPIPFS